MSAVAKITSPVNRMMSRLFGVRLTRVGYHDPLRYHERHKKEALEALGILESANSSKLSTTDKRRADADAISVLGGREYAPWLYVYAAMAGEFRDGWIPDNFFGSVVVPRINNRLGHATGLKTLSARLLQSDAIPDLAYHVDGVFYAKDFTVISLDALSDIATNAGAHVFVKADRSSQGKGVAKIASRDLRGLDFRKIGDCVVQSAVEQHERVPRVAVVGWDLTVSKDSSIKIFEWNGGHCDIKFSEATVGPCFTGLNWESLRS